MRGITIEDAGRPLEDVVESHLPPVVRRVFRAAAHEVDDRWDEPELTLTGDFTEPFDEFPATDPINAARRVAAAGRPFEGVYIEIILRGTRMSIACRGDVNNHPLDDLVRWYNIADLQARE